MLVAVETLLLITISIKYMYAYCQPNSTLPTHFVSFFPSWSRLSLLWDAVVVFPVSPPDLLVKTLGPRVPIPTILSYILYHILYTSIFLQCMEIATIDMCFLLLLYLPLK